MRKLTLIVKNILAALLIVSLGLHWGLFQSVAWVSMIVKYSATESFIQSLQMTFDGKHPCALCKIVDATKKAEQEKNGPAPKHAAYLDICCSYQVFDFYISPVAPPYPPATIESFRQESPPTPPPRLV